MSMEDTSITPNKQRLSGKTVCFILLILLGLDALLIYNWTRSGHGMGIPLLENAFLGTLVAALYWIAFSAPITSLLAIVLLVITSIRSHKGERLGIFKSLYIFNIDIMLYYLLFWILIVSIFVSMELVFPEGRNTALLIDFTLILIVSSISLCIKAFQSRHWLTQVSALFLFLLVFGALLFNIKIINQPYHAPQILAEYPSPNKNYKVIFFRQQNDKWTEEFYGFQSKTQKYSRRLGVSCDLAFIKWIDNETILVSYDSTEQEVRIINNQPNYICP